MNNAPPLRATEYSISVIPDGHPLRCFADLAELVVTISDGGLEGEARWAVRYRNRVADGTGALAHEPRPSERDEPFLDAYRHTIDDAERVARIVAAEQLRILEDRHSGSAKVAVTPPIPGDEAAQDDGAGGEADDSGGETSHGVAWHEMVKPGGRWYATIMPFVTIDTNGGEHEAESYLAGFEMGAADARLAIAAIARAERLVVAVRRSNLPQLRVIGARHGFTIEGDGDGDGERGWIAQVEMVRA